MKCWFFQRTPGRFDWRDKKDIKKSLEKSEAEGMTFSQFSGVSEDWTAERLFNEMQPGDIAYFWESGAEGGLEGWGHIQGVAENDGSGYWISVGVDVLLTRVIPRGEVGVEPAMRRHAIFMGGAAGANHRCDVVQALELNHHLIVRNAPVPDVEKAEQNLPKGRAETDQEEDSAPSVLPAARIVAEKAELSESLTIDCQRLLETAVGSLRQKDAKQDQLSTSTVFLAAINWSLSEEIDHVAPRGLLRMTHILTLSNGSALGRIREDFFSYTSPTAVFDLAEKDVPDFDITANLRQALQSASQSKTGDISAIDVMRSLLRHVGSSDYQGNWFSKRFSDLEVSFRDLEMALLPGASTHVTSDHWTTDDQLGYREYARAIYHFLRDPRTRPPLTISIQAPWGGGKTSLMRMVQRELDPESQSEAQVKTLPLRSSAGGILVKDLLKEIRAIADGNPSETQIDLGKEDGFPTVWFNAWAYQSHKQIWAGLGEAIIRNLSERLDPVQREKFLLRLHLARIDPNAIRSKIYESTTQRFLGYLRGALGLFVGAAVVVAAGAILAFGQGLENLFGWTIAGSTFSAFLASAIGYGAALRTTESEPANVSLSDYLSVPDYGEELGFVHHVAEDLRRVLDILPSVQGPDGETRRAPIVLFIDDLDRCSPTKVAEVFEAINLFVAGEFPNCYVILGMDTEIVAAALEEAHKQVIARLPSYSQQTAVGWRFMDKFVQLPFIIPPISIETVRSFAGYLAASENLAAAKVQTRAAEEGQIETGSARFDEFSDKLAGEAADEDAPRLDPGAQEAERIAKKKSEYGQKLKFIDERAALLSQDSREIEILLQQAYTSFSRNPRELKRLANVYRFYMNLRLARLANNEPVPTVEQTRNWVVLMLAWPEAYRWLRGGKAALETEAVDAQAIGIAQLLGELERTAFSMTENNVDAGEDTEVSPTGLEGWITALERLSGLERKSTQWISNERLFLFFQNVAKAGPEGSLASTAGKGFW